MPAVPWAKKRVAAGSAAAITLLLSAWLVAGWGGPAVVRTLSDIGSVVCGLFATGCAVWAARTSGGRQRWGWALMATGLGGWVFGDTVWAYYELVAGLDVAPFPSVSDVGYLLFPVAAGAALVVFRISAGGLSGIRTLLDGVVLAGSLFLISWAIGLHAVVAAGTDDPLGFAISLAYPLSDIVLLTMSVVLLLRSSARQRPAITVLTVGIIAMSLSDSAFAYLAEDSLYVSGHLVDVGWLVGLTSMGVAATLAVGAPVPRPAPPRMPSWASLSLLYLPLSVAAIVTSRFLITAVGQATVPPLVAATVVVAAVLARQFLVVAENRRLLVQIGEQALRDPLTGLANRALFMDRLTHAVALQTVEAREVAVLSVDLDDFKLVNDSLGHSAGDALLVEVAERLLRCAHQEDTVARLGGDEFTVLLEECPHPPESVARRIEHSFDAPFRIDGQDVTVRASVGVATQTTPDTDPDTSAQTLLKNADLAMYCAKRDGTGVERFTGAMRLLDLVEADLAREPLTTPRHYRSAQPQLLNELRHAVDHGELSVVYQPQCCAGTGEVTKVEALVRWPHPRLGVVMPGAFLPLARHNGLMGAITDVVLDRCARDAAQWRTAGVDMPLAVNIFPPSLSDHELPERIVRIMSGHGVSADRLTLEITEDFLLRPIDNASEALQRLRDNGIRIAIDDFGSGYSALSYLTRLPVDEVKLDLKSIGPVVADDRAQVVVQTVIAMARALHLTSVAEGVEDAATAAAVTRYGCDLIQGHYFSVPVAPDAVPRLRGDRTPVAGAIRR
jgi:diguanylate cyclase